LQFSIGTCSLDISTSGKGVIYCSFYRRKPSLPEELGACPSLTPAVMAAPPASPATPSPFSSGASKGRPRPCCRRLGAATTPAAVKVGTRRARSLVTSEVVLLRIPERKQTERRRAGGTPRGRLGPHPACEEGRTHAARHALGKRLPGKGAAHP